MSSRAVSRKCCQIPLVYLYPDGSMDILRVQAPKLRAETSSCTISNSWVVGKLNPQFPHSFAILCEQINAAGARVASEQGWHCMMTNTWFNQKTGSIRLKVCVGPMGDEPSIIIKPVGIRNGDACASSSPNKIDTGCNVIPIIEIRCMQGTRPGAIYMCDFNPVIHQALVFP